MRALFLLLAISLAGCASSRRAEVTPPPPTLSEVNRALDGHRATVVYKDGRKPERAFVFVGARETIVRQDRPVETTGESQVEEKVIDTEDILRVEIDASLTPWQGAGNGSLYGALPGVLMAGGGAVSFAVSDCDYCGGQALLIGGGAALAVLGAALGTGAGAVGAAPTEMVAVYEAPVTRYPDAALALMERDAAPLAEPMLTGATAPEAAAPER